MASKLINGPSIKNVVARTYAAQAAVATKQQNYSLPQQQPEVTRLPNGALAVTFENNLPVSKLAIFAQAGPRYESDCTKGVSHVARLCAGTTTENFLALALTRRIQQFGGNLVCQAGREHMSYGMSFLREHLNESFEMLCDVALHPNFFPWEVQKQKLRLLTELGVRDPSVIAIDMLHEAAFRRSGLGNSLFIPDHKIGNITAEQLHEFVKQTHSTPRVAFVGLGMEHKTLVKLAKGLKATSGGDAAASPASYGGGEVRCETGTPLAYVAVAGPGAKLGSDEATSLAIAQYILGGTPGTARGSNASGKLSSILAGAGGHGSACAINASYSDGGLFGFHLVVEKENAEAALRALTKGIRSLKITDADVKSAKAKAKAAVLMSAECSENECEDMGVQGLFLGKYSSPSETVAAIDQVTAASVQSALSNATKGKPSMSAYGGISNVPYLDEL